MKRWNTFSFLMGMLAVLSLETVVSYIRLMRDTQRVVDGIRAVTKQYEDTLRIMARGEREQARETHRRV